MFLHFLSIPIPKLSPVVAAPFVANHIQPRVLLRFQVERETAEAQPSPKLDQVNNKCTISHKYPFNLQVALLQCNRYTREKHIIPVELQDLRLPLPLHMAGFLSLHLPDPR